MNSQPGRSINQSEYNNVSLYTWTNLVYQGRYQFGVVAFTSKGPGEAANLPFDIQCGK